jgi:hypothetical protein
MRKMLAMTEPKDASFDVEANLLSVKFDLSPLEARFLRVLLARPGASKDDFPEVIFAIRQLVYTLRKKVEGIGGVYIVNDGGGHYSMPRSSKRLLREQLGEIE